MADFDPDKYLAEKTAPQMVAGGASGGFDPDKSLAEKKGEALSSYPANNLKGQALIDFMKSGKDQSERGRAELPTGGDFQTALEHGANQVTLGYLPQLQAAAEPVTDAIGNALSSTKIQPRSYVEARDANIERLAEEEKQNPGSAFGGKAAGMALSAYLTPGGAAKGILGAAGKTAAYGAAYGGLQNPGDVKGQVDPIQAEERLKNAAKGGLIGLGSGLATGTASALLNKGADKLSHIESTQALKGAGAMTKEFRELNGKELTDEVGKFAREKGIVQAGDTVESVLPKARAIQNESGKQLGELYQQAQDTMRGLGKKAYGKVEKIGINPVRDKEEILNLAAAKLKNEEGGPAALERLSKYLDSLRDQHGDMTLDPLTAHEVKSAVDRTINYSRNPLQSEPDRETAFRELRKFINNKIQSQVDFLADKMGNPEAGKALKEANRNYGFSKTLGDMAQNSLGRIQAHKMVSLTDTIAGGAGVATGTGLGYIMGGDSKHAAEGGLAGGLLSAVGNHAFSKYGPGLVSAGAGRLAVPMGLLQKSGGGYLGQLLNSPEARKGLVQYLQGGGK